MSFRLTLSFFSFLLPTHTQKSGLFAASLFWNSRHFTFSFYCRPCPEPVDLPGFPRLSLHLFPQVPFVLEFTPLQLNLVASLTGGQSNHLFYSHLSVKSEMWYTEYVMYSRSACMWIEKQWETIVYRHGVKVREPRNLASGLLAVSIIL